MVVVLVMAIMGAGCGSGPTPRMSSYVGGEVKKDQGSRIDRQAGPLAPAGLLVINDTLAPDSAPPLSQDQLQALTEWLRGRINQDFPISIEQVLSVDAVQPTGTVDHIAELGNAQELRYVVLAVLSSSESEVPERFLLGGVTQGGGGRGQVVGYHVENYALAEIAILDVERRQVLLQVTGQDWASLDRLKVPLASNVFPVIHRAQQTAPIYPSEEEAYDVLRGVAAGEALAQALMHMKEAWAATFS